MKFKLLFPALLVLSVANAQQPANPCLFDDLKRQNSSLIEEAEKQISAALSSTAKNLRKSTHTPVKRIPVVVHIIHNGGAENISDAQVQSQITILNEDYRRLSGTNGSGNGVDTEVEFVLAQKDPAGRCTNGIVRIKSALTSHQTYQRSRLKDLSFWDNTRFLNIYIVKSINNGSGTLGYASFPGGPATEDGIVVLHNAFGNTGTVSSGTSYSKGRTTTHEVGHWLGLYHTFQDGCGTDTCSTGDYVCDTPPAKNPNFGCPSGINSCNNDAPDLPDQIDNYMDYSDDACKSMFSKGQKLRMQAALTSIRNIIHTDSNLVFTGTDSGYVSGPCNVVADFTASGTNVCVGSTVSFISKALNNPISWKWYFPGGNPVSSTAENPSVKYDSAGTYKVKLVIAGTLGTDSIEVPGYITVTAPPTGQALPFSEGFESSIFPSNGITINNPDGGITWIRTDSAAYTGSWSAKINNLINTNYGQSDEIILPGFDLTAYPGTPYLKFNWAYARSDANYSDELIVLASTDCGLNYTQVFYRTGSSLATGPTQKTPFVPNSSQWKAASINLTAYKPFRNVILKIVNVTDGGNNLYIDNLSIGDALTGVSQQEKEHRIEVYPNPANAVTTLYYSLPSAGHVKISLYDLVGKEIKVITDQPVQSGTHTAALETSGLNASVYFIRYETTEGIEIKKLVVNK